MTPIIEVHAVRKRYGDVEAVRGIDLTVHAGEVVALLGPNGAGKTTMIAMMLGLRRPSAGGVRLFGLDPTDRQARSRLGVMLQESGIPGALTVAEVLDLFRAFYASPLPAATAIRMAGLERHAARRIAALSGGERQRVAFALAVCGDPDLLVLDEPTVGMDVESRRAFVVSIRALAASGRTVLFSTHYLREAEELAGRIVVIDHGRIVADATPVELTSRIAGKRMTFTVPPGTRATAFTGLPIEGLERTDERVRLLSSEPVAVLAALAARGVDVGDLEVVGADLEEAFLTLTQSAEVAA